MGGWGDLHPSALQSPGIYSFQMIHVSYFFTEWVGGDGGARGVWDQRGIRLPRPPTHPPAVMFSLLSFLKLGGFGEAVQAGRTALPLHLHHFVSTHRHHIFDFPLHMILYFYFRYVVGGRRLRPIHLHHLGIEIIYAHVLNP